MAGSSAGEISKATVLAGHDLSCEPNSLISSSVNTPQIFNLILALIPRSPLTYFLTINLPISLLQLRSDLIRSAHTRLSLASNVFELVYWCALVTIPYSEDLDNALSGSRSKGGGSLGSYGADLPKHIEEPTCKFIILLESELTPA